MPIDLSEEDLERLLAAIEHYDAYLKSQQREDSAYRELIERLQRIIRKPTASAPSKAAAKVKSR
ncbi:MAG TPA: hypothetical protein VNV82_13180 [Bryobacteraceae bacterium]|jgi:hypothetical protein|nr:hypothetical protein [Bryobacteraceae bacterium]